MMNTDTMQVIYKLAGKLSLDITVIPVKFIGNSNDAKLYEKPVATTDTVYGSEGLCDLICPAVPLEVYSFYTRSGDMFDYAVDGPLLMIFVRVVDRDFFGSDFRSFQRKLTSSLVGNSKRWIADGEPGGVRGNEILIVDEIEQIGLMEEKG